MEEQDSGWGRKSGAVDLPLLEISGGLFGFRDKKAFKAHLEWSTLDGTGDCRERQSPKSAKLLTAPDCRQKET